MESERLRHSPATSLPRVLFLTVLAIISAALLLGLATLVNGAVRSAVLVDTLPTENTVASIELSAAWDTMLLGLVVSLVSAAVGAALLVANRRRLRAS